MQPTPGHIIRVLRRALKMSQREFARALGWAPSTISRWERDEAPPSRLALKTILAFAEERGVRYKPKPHASARALVPLHDPPPCPLPERPQGFHLPPSGPVLETSDSRGSGERFLSITAERPRWRAEANVHLFAARQQAVSPRRSRAALHSAGIMAAGLCVVLSIGLPGSAKHASPRGTTPEATLVSVETPSSMSSSTGHEEQAPASAAFDWDTPSDVSAPDAVTDASPQAPAPASAPAPVARLESIVMIGDTHRATFRTNIASVTVTEGSWLAGQHVELIGTDHVDLLSSAGETRTVRIGTPIRLD